MAYDITSMREDAIRRAREMYSRATPVPLSLESQEEATKQEDGDQATYHNNEVSQTETNNQGLNIDFLSNFFQDKERMLIIALLVILSQEKENNAILFSLMYLLI